MWYADVRDEMTRQPGVMIYKESVRRFISFGQAVAREEIHLLSQESLYDHHLKIFQCMACGVEVNSHWFLCLVLDDVSMMAVHSFI